MRVVRTKKKVKFTPAPRNDTSTYMADVVIQPGEHVLLIGQIDNVRGSVAISTWDGNVLWPVNLDDLEEIA